MTIEHNHINQCDAMIINHYTCFTCSSNQMSLKIIKENNTTNFVMLICVYIMIKILLNIKQVMYMYYLLGYKLFGKESEEASIWLQSEENQSSFEGMNWLARKTKQKSRKRKDGKYSKKQMFEDLREALLEQVSPNFHDLYCSI